MLAAFTSNLNGRAEESAIKPDQLVPILDIQNSRKLAIVSLVSPILFITSLAAAAIIVMSGRSNELGALWFWALAQCFFCAVLFLICLREKSILFDRDMFTLNSVVWRQTATTLGFVWGAVPVGLVTLFSYPEGLAAGSVLSGLILSSTLFLRSAPKIATGLLIAICSGFVGYSFVSADTWSTVICMFMLIYSSTLGVCTRWYYARFDQRLEQAERVHAETVELKTVLDELGDSTLTIRWRTNSQHVFEEVSNVEKFGRPEIEDLAGMGSRDLFLPSPELDIFLARLSRQSEVVGLELQARPDAADRKSWWRISARPIYKGGRFQGYRGTATDITELKTSESRATFLTENDELTGLLNRTSFYRALDAHISTLPDRTTESGLLWLDLDNFKWINDTFGHAGGDELLKMVAKRLKNACGSSDRVCRFGGDEFAVLTVGHLDKDSLSTFVNQLTRAMSRPYTLELSEVQCSASVGFKHIDRAERDPSGLLKEADLALYAAKAGGRATWKEYSEEFKAKVRGQRELARDLGEAIGTEDLKLQFQPIVDGKTEAVVGVEALLRWAHPTRGSIKPSEFIEIAENNGLMVELGDSVVAKAIQAASKLPDHIRVGINISPLQIHSSALLILIENKISEFGVDPARLELEITETVFLSDNEFVLERLRRLKSLGVRIVLDDFGTGFSSLAYLQRFPFDKLKLDQAFVREIETNEQSCAIARATISMAHALGLTVTAEGVETQAQAEFLKQQGCDELQGFLYSQPKTSQALSQFLSEQNALMIEPLSDPYGKVVQIGKVRR